MLQANINIDFLDIEGISLFCLQTAERYDGRSVSRAKAPVQTEAEGS
jgi:hypothetical protein